MSSISLQGESLMTEVNPVSHDGKEDLKIEPKKDAVSIALRQTIDDPSLAD
jgi:hypothetical protein